MFRSYFFNIRLTVRDALFDEIEQFLSSEALFRGADEHRWKFLPLFAERFAEAGDTAVGLCFRQFVRFREYDAERDAVLTEHLDEIQVDGLRFESDVDQYEEEMEPFAAEYIIEDDFRELAAGRLRGAGIAVAGQVDQIPTVVDAEMVDKPCFARGSRDLGQPVAVCQHVDERRFAHVAAADERDVGKSVFRHLCDAFRGAFELGVPNLHDGFRCGLSGVKVEKKVAISKKNHVASFCPFVVHPFIR